MITSSWLGLWAFTSGSTPAIAADCDPGAGVVSGLQAYLAGDLAAARARLSEAEVAFGCGAPVDPQALVRYFLVEGAVLLREGDAESARDYFAAARRLSSEQWLPNLADEARELWLAASTEGIGRIVVEPAPGGRPVWVDGTSGVPEGVPSGLHLVQIGDGTGVVVFAGFVWVGPDVAAVVDSGLPPIGDEPVRPPPKEPKPARTPSRPGLDLVALVGGSLSSGEALVYEDLEEPSLPIAVPLSVGIGVELGPWLFVGARGGAAWLTNGRYLGSTAGGRVVASALRYDAALLVGAGRRVRGGLAAGLHYPGRLTGRAWFGITAGRWLYAEAHGGVNVPTERAIEPAGELLVGLRY